MAVKVQFITRIALGRGAITRGERRALLDEAGFANPRVAEQPMPTRFVMLAEQETASGASSGVEVSTGSRAKRARSSRGSTGEERARGESVLTRG